MPPDLIRPAITALFLSVGLTCAGCGGDSGTSPTILPGAPYSQTDVRAGTGTEAAAGRRATVNYTGWLYDPVLPENKGLQFDTSIGRQPFVLTVGAGQVIRGFDQGVTGMRVGGQRRVVIPPDLAYGSTGSQGVIPPNATLVFDIELLEVS
jgi:FKBP-type peptidyl-prolyl cis-trans isomerase FkpA